MDNILLIGIVFFILVVLTGELIHRLMIRRKAGRSNTGRIKVRRKDQGKDDWRAGLR